MGHTITLAALGAVAFMVLDGVWLGLLMKNFYRDQLAPIAASLSVCPIDIPTFRASVFVQRIPTQSSCQ